MICWGSCFLGLTPRQTLQPRCSRLLRAGEGGKLLRARGFCFLRQARPLLRVREDDVERTVWLALHGGGLVLAGGTVLVVTPVSPLGRAIVGQCAGDVCELAAGSRMREIEIVAVR